MSQRYQGGFLTASYFPLKTPNAPTIGTATAGDASASVAFTAPANVGGGAITGYTVTSSPGGFTGTGASSPITVSGLSNGTAYTFTVVATNAFGTGPQSAASNSATPVPPVQTAYTTPGTYSWVAPSGLSPATVSVVCVGGGGGGFATGAGDGYYAGACGGGGGLGYKNGYSVTSGSSYTVVVGAGAVMSTGAQTNGGTSYFVSTGLVRGGGGNGGSSASPGAGAGAGGDYAGDGGGNGGNGSGGGQFNSSNYFPGGGGGAGGYAGNGGAGAPSAGPYTNGSAGSGGGGGGGSSGYGSIGGMAGGGVGILGQGSNGAGGGNPSGGGGGSGGAQGGGFGAPGNPAQGAPGGAYGGGGGGGNPSTGNGGNHNGGLGGVGAVRLIYSFSGVTRSFPSTNTGDL